MLSMQGILFILLLVVIFGGCLGYSRDWHTGFYGGGYGYGGLLGILLVVIVVAIIMRG